MAQLATEATLDGQLELKKRARRRLVGAAALALLAAILLPMVMDHEPRQPAQDVQVRIPSQDAGGIAAKILPNRAAPTPLPPAPPDSAPDAKPEALLEARPAAEIPRDERPAAKAAEKPAEPWLVLIGAYKDAANVRQLTGKLRQIGVPAFTEHFDSPQGPRTRVRAGPFKTREAADQALAKMKKIGVDGLVKQSAK